MAFDEALAATVRALVSTVPGMVEKKMFGGLGFLLNGNMSVGIQGAELVVRIAPEATAAALSEPGARVFDFSGRPMKGWLLIGGSTLVQKKVLAAWVGRGIAFAKTLPAK